MTGRFFVPEDSIIVRRPRAFDLGNDKWSRVLLLQEVKFGKYYWLHLDGTIEWMPLDFEPSGSKPGATEVGS